MSTYIAKWQLTSVHDFEECPLYYKWCTDMRLSFLDQTSWVLSVDEITDKSKNMFKLRKVVLSQNVFSLPPSNDKEFDALWNLKSDCLKQLYTAIHWMMVQHSHDPYLADIYREKVDQALDWLSGVTNVIPPMIQIEMINDSSTTVADTIANNIVSQRNTWLTRISSIEQTRLLSKREIIQSQDVTIIKQALTYGLKHLTDLDQNWDHI